MANEKELQEKMLIYRTLESRLEILTRQRDLVSSKIGEIVSSIASLDGLDQKNILFKIGDSVFVEGAVASKDKILVEIGAGIIM